jgi:dTDP-4-amino-4,6-dideoxygalactose transaminase
MKQFGKLAIEGGAPAIAEGPPDWPLADEAVLAALSTAFADGSWGKYDGPHTQRLSARLSELHGGASVLLCCSGTIAVELALRGLKIGAGDEVILAGYDFPGNFRAIEAVGARPVLVDLAAGNWVIDPEQVAAAVSPRTKAVIVSHLHGALADMRRITELARQHGLAVVEDACQSPGAMVQGRIAGGWGDVGVHSFGGSKLLSAGRGGAIVTPHAEVAQRIKVYSERGNQAFPLSELQAAVLVPQLERLAERNARRRQGAGRLREQLAAESRLSLVADASAESNPAYYKVGMLYWPALSEGAAAEPIRRRRYIAAIRAEGVAIDEGFRGFAGRSTARCRRVGNLPHAKAAAAGTLLLHHPVLLSSEEQIDRVAAAIRKVAEALP